MDSSPVATLLPNDPVFPTSDPEQWVPSPDALAESPGLPVSSSRGAHGGRGLPRRAVWAVCGAAAMVCVLSGEPLATAVLCLALSTLVAAALVPAAGGHGSGVLASIPAGFVLLCGWALVWGSTVGTAGFAAWGDRGPAVLGTLALALLTGFLVWRRGGSVLLVGRDRSALVGFAAVLGFFTWVVASQPLSLWSRVNASGTDFARHLAAVRALRMEGALVPGESGYPSVLHALAAWLTASQGTVLSADSLWRSVAPIGFLMLGLVMLGIMVTARGAADATMQGNWPGVAAAGVGAAVFIQTAWFSSFLSFGNVMNMLVGVCLVALLVQGLIPASFGSTAGSAVAAAAVGVTANAWQLLLPVVCIAVSPWFVAHLIRGRHRWVDWTVWVIGGLLAVSGILGLRSIDGRGHAALATVSDLFRPDWWWAVGVALSLLAIGTAARCGRRGWSAVALGMLVSAAALVAGLLLLTGSTWELMRYYPVKALWTTIVVVIPLGSVGGVLLVVAAWRWAGQRSEWGRLAVRGGLALLIGLTIAGVLGRGAAFPPHLVPIADGRAGMPSWSLALVESLRDVPIPPEAEEGAIVFGLVPAADVGGVTGGLVGMVDFMAMEGLGQAGVEGAEAAPVKAGLVTRDMTQVCRYLMDHPESARITGPNPAAGPQWIVDSGCPEAIVQPDRWISLDIDPVWFERSPWEDGNWVFPSFDEMGIDKVRV